MPPTDLAGLDEERLNAWLRERRWFGAKARDVAHVHVLDVITIHEGPPVVLVALVEARFPTGTHDVYQLVLARRPAAENWSEAVLAQLDGATIYDALSDPQATALLAGLLRDGAVVAGEHARVSFHWHGDLAPPAPGATARPMGVEQSNTSVVFDRALVLKTFRRIEAGDNPELEMLRFLTARGFPHVAALGGWYEYAGELMDATLGVVQRYVGSGRDGWELALDEIATAPGAFVARLDELGRVIGALHNVLAGDPSDPAFAPEEPSHEGLSLLTATIDEQIERAFVDLPDDVDDLAPIAGRGAEVRDRLALLSHVGVGGRLIRHHGDLHLGQALLADEGWFILDFEGEPARALIDRRRKRSPLRDVAGMLRSFAYVASASERQRGVTAPEGWEERAREAFLAGYLEVVEGSLLPAGEAATRTLLSIFELEKAVYELRYELDNRPDWVAIPVAGIIRLLEEPLP